MRPQEQNTQKACWRAVMQRTCVWAQIRVLHFIQSQHSKKKKKKAVRTRLFIYLLTYVSSMTVETFRRNEMKWKKMKNSNYIYMIYPHPPIHSSSRITDRSLAPFPGRLGPSQLFISFSLHQWIKWKVKRDQDKTLPSTNLFLPSIPPKPITTSTYQYPIKYYIPNQGKKKVLILPPPNTNTKTNIKSQTCKHPILNANIHMPRHIPFLLYSQNRKVGRNVNARLSLENDWAKGVTHWARPSQAKLGRPEINKQRWDEEWKNGNEKNENRESREPRRRYASDWFACSPDYQSPTLVNSGARLREEDWGGYHRYHSPHQKKQRHEPRTKQEQGQRKKVSELYMGCWFDCGFEFGSKSGDGDK